MSSTSRDRVLAALGLEEPDRVPLFEYIIDQPIVERVSGLGLGMESKLLCLRRLGIDVYHALKCPPKRLRGSGTRSHRPNGMRLLENGLLLDEWGILWRLSEDGVRYWYAGGTIKGPGDLEAFTPPDPSEEGRLEKLEFALKRVGGSMSIWGQLHDAFGFPWQMRGGLEPFLIDTYRRPDFLRKLMEVSFRFNLELGKAMADLGVDAVTTGDDYADKHGPLMHPRAFGELFQPYIKELARAMKRRGLFFVKHCDGYILSIIKDLLEADVDALHPIEPLAGMEIGAVKEAYGTDLCLIGNIDCAYTLVMKSREDVEREVEECIREASPGGGHILSSSNTVHSGVRAESLTAMVEAARRYGRYPIKPLGG